MEDKIVIVDYDPEWPALFEKERALIVAAFDGMITGIEHFGSTSVPGIAAKPVIDIMLLVEKLGPLEQYRADLEKLEYVYQNWPGEQEGHLFFHKGTPRAYHLHIVEQGTLEHLRHIAFRDYLRAHPEVASAYVALKQDLSQKFSSNREAYTSAKTEFVRAIEALAISG